MLRAVNQSTDERTIRKSTKTGDSVCQGKKRYIMKFPAKFCNGFRYLT